jgi:hypothetical protein
VLIRARANLNFWRTNVMSKNTMTIKSVAVALALGLLVVAGCVSGGRDGKDGRTGATGRAGADGQTGDTGAAGEDGHSPTVIIR